MGWFTHLFHSPFLTKRSDCQNDRIVTILKKLEINTVFSITAACEAELKSYRELAYSPLPQRIFSVGRLNIDRNLVRRYYLWSDEIWLQVSFDKHNDNKVTEIILFYWLQSKILTADQLTNDVRLPLSASQWQYLGNLYQRCFDNTLKSHVPMVEYVVNKHESYHVECEQIIFSRQLTPERNEYWFYSLEKNQNNDTYLQVSAQGFSLNLSEICVS